MYPVCLRVRLLMMKSEGNASWRGSLTKLASCVSLCFVITDVSHVMPFVRNRWQVIIFGEIRRPLVQWSLTFFLRRLP